MKWVVTTDTNLCRIYQLPDNAKELSLVKEIAHPENRMKRGDYFTSDKPGRYQTDSAAHGSYAQRSDPRDVSIEKFMREVAAILNQGRNENAYQQLILVTPAHTEGLLLNQVDRHVKNLIIRKIQKDVMHLADHELREFMQEHRKE